MKVFYHVHMNHTQSLMLIAIQIRLPSGSQSVGLAAWEATTNLSVRVYLQYATAYELNHWDRGMCL